MKRGPQLKTDTHTKKRKMHVDDFSEALWLPQEVWQLILSFLTPREVVAGLANKTWYKSAENLSLEWKRKYFPPHLFRYEKISKRPLKTLATWYQKCKELCGDFSSDLIWAALNGKLHPQPEIAKNSTIYEISFYNAVRHRDMDTVKSLLGSVGTVNTEPKQRALQYAAEEGDLNMVSMLLYNGHCYPKQETLNIAAKKGHLHVLKGMVNYIMGVAKFFKTKITLEHDLGQALAHGAKHPQTDVVEYCLKSSEIPIGFIGWGLHNAAKKGNLSNVMLLSKPEVSSENKGLALKKATERGHLYVVKAILAIPGLLEKDKDKAYIEANNKGYTEIANLIAGARLQQQSEESTVIKKASC